MSRLRTFPRPLVVLLAVGALSASASLAARAGEKAPPPSEKAATAEAGALDFLPTPSGNVGAFLVAGPFEGPQGGIERMGPAREAGALPGDLRWELATTRDGSGIVVGRAGGGAGIYYARTEFPEGGRGGRAISVVASCSVTAWADGETLTAPAYTRKALEVDARPGATILLLRLEPERGRAGFAVRAGMKLPADRILPEGGRLELADVSKERIAGLVRGALRLRLSPKLASEKAPVLVEFTRVGSPPDLPGEIDVELAPVEDEFLRPHRGRPSQRVKLREFGAKLRQGQVSASFMVQPGAPGLFTVEARVTREGERLATLAATGYVSEGLGGLADSLEERGRSLAGKFPSVGAYARLQADKVRLSLGHPGGPAEPGLLAEDIGLAERGLAEAQEGRDFQKDLTGFRERAYVSGIDDSAQPYLVYVPTYYKPGEPMPLVVYLHGYVPTYDKDDWLKGDPQVNAVMEAEGCILAVPFGRSNTDFLNVGEDDVLAVIDEMKRHYSIDPRRIYLYGYSMGGSGVWTMLVHYPDRFAAAVVLAGRTDYFLWHGVEREDLPPWRRFIIETDNPIDYVENIVHVPVRIYHGAADWVIKREQSKRMADKLKAAGGTCELYWIPRGTHWTMFDTVLWTREPVAWMKEHALPEEPPEEFSVRTCHPRHGYAWGLGFRPKSCLEPSELHVRRQDGKILARFRNAYYFLTRSTHFSSLLSQNRLEFLDGETMPSRKERQAVVSKAYAPWGPIKDAFRSPFCIVYGTQGGEEAKREVKANAERFRKEWRDFAKGWAPILADTEVTNEIMAKKNLILFGEPETNSLLASFADSLPIKWDHGEATIAGRKYSMKRRGLAFIYPNPKHPQRAVVVFSGVPWGAHLPSNHKWDLMPDFILYTPEADEIDRMEKTNDWLVAGFFGTDWSLERGRIFVKGVGEVDAKGEPVAPAAGVEPAPATEAVPEPPPGFERVH